ncbi:adenylosuccinate lyase [Aerococcus urinaehominis]|uniref:Adenylosuccinate lyase n=1 Tax=Aerococcus urinaehominis TaxID=128944 RepID=A0A0X8FM30_9LACT|nr:adenylosuccinate lyase [Aerococcus urinaehominis]AMB99827.1 adenylosuccinate lyase [Aerococcus urinaehominis]SDM55468.1 adenylosuccinate lyase [Aerococcus urinaehominis]
MASHVIDLLTLQGNFSTPEMRAIWTDENRLQQQLKVEAALAQAEAKLGLIPEQAAEAIEKASQADLYDIEEIAAESARLKHSMMATINALQAQTGDYGEYVHYGVTTQDVVDTGHMLQVKASYQIIKADLLKAIDHIAQFADDNRDAVMAGRTHGMHALPTTLAFKAVVWLDEFIRHYQRAQEMEGRVFVGNISGGVGTYASFGDLGAQVETETLEILGLGVPNISWQSSRDRFSEYANVLALISASLGKIGNELYNLMRTDIGEIEEGFTDGKVGSSTMPHKRNPAAIEGLVSLTPPIQKAAELIHHSMMTEHERDAMSWRQEWVALPEINIYLAAQLANFNQILPNLLVRKDKMTANLNSQHGLIVSERVMFEVAKALGKQTAHHVVYENAMTSFEQGRDFLEVLSRDGRITQHFDKAALEDLLDPANYTGLADQKVDQVLAYYKEFRKDV